MEIATADAVIKKKLMSYRLYYGRSQLTDLIH